jgi:hypothetical protein
MKPEEGHMKPLKAAAVAWCVVGLVASASTVAAQKTDEKGKEASVKIDPHNGHKVTVTGPTTTAKGDTMMTVTSLEMVSTTCP